MPRTTLKLTKPRDPNAAPKPPTSRARRAQQGRKLPKPTTPTPAVSAVPVAAEAASTIRAAPRPGSRGKKDDPRRAKPAAKAGDPGRSRRPPGPAAKSVKRARPEVATKPAIAAVSAPSPRRDRADLPRLSKRMSELGLCSRREADDWIVNGWVKVDGVVVDTLGTRVAPDARIEIDAAAAKHQSEQVTILLNKPIGYVSGLPEDGHAPAMVLITPENRWEGDRVPTQFRPGHLRGLAPAGRLDIDSTGLIVFTQDGRVAKRLVGRDSSVEKEYLVRVEGKLRDGGLELLRHGLELDGVKLKPAKVSWQNEDQLRFVLNEGRKRQIRRMCELVGLVVVGLKRVRCGSVALGPLPVGRWRYLRRDEKF